MLLKTYNKIYDTDIGYSFFNSKLAVISSTIFFIILFCSVFAGIVAPYNPFDPASVSLMDAFTPPVRWFCIYNFCNDTWSFSWNNSWIYWW